MSLNDCYAFKSLNEQHRNIEIKHFNNKLMFGKVNLLYLNINSILNKLDDLQIHLHEILLKNKKKTIHMIALTEVRLHDNITPYFNLPLYTSFYSTRSDGYGGCALFV